MSQHFFDQFLFVALPYVCLFTFFLMTIYRYRVQSFSYSSLSSQFLENKHHFWAVVPFHYGILVVTAGHFLAFLIPRSLLAWNSKPWRLYVLEISALAFGILTLIGLVGVIVRRMSSSKVRMVTTPTDWLLFLMLLVQTVSGVSIALFYPWGSSWFATNMSPYLWSILKLDPDVTFVAAMPWLVKLHVVLAFLTIGFFPFTRLVHVLVIPNPYLWRKTQVVRWYSRKEGKT
ncbi:respiratory nitrate reductase subunit gamma [Bythopirellula polymerisocia]|uniref:Respiratory nitrate reductase 2 gamma chain n=1 Tax=Bythopirellula polymerisocia TaxID=2528003 RepID=A0A5C6CCF6_9BACT|nr:respiratory nitrate reductase subunit gamma [Bythopirellula polymerisocia]TWU21782.1 Respiratory nitrate reductase 2 gamma chain [Bythopirellula polymerisocia]